MILIVGGMGQGKRDFALNSLGVSVEDFVDGERTDLSELYKCRCVYNCHLAVRRLIDKGENPSAFFSNVTNENSDIIIIMNEVGSGIIPIEKKDRIWREQVGKTGCMLAEKADSVYRLVCGIPVTLKGKGLSI